MAPGGPPLAASESVKKSLAAPNRRQGVEGKARPAPT
jgi:hypothetical protein